MPERIKGVFSLRFDGETADSHGITASTLPQR